MYARTYAPECVHVNMYGHGTTKRGRGTTPQARPTLTAIGRDAVGVVNFAQVVGLTQASPDGLDQRQV